MCNLSLIVFNQPLSYPNNPWNVSEKRNYFPNNDVHLKAVEHAVQIQNV